MSEGSFSQILEAIEKPIRYASRNDYANLRSLKGLEAYISYWLKKANSFPLSPPQRDLLAALQRQLLNFDHLELAAKKERLSQLQKLIHSFKFAELTTSYASPWPSLSEFRQWRKDLQTPMQFLKGIGPRLSAVLKKKNIHTVEDALYFLPRAYQDRRQIKKISQLQIGRIETVMGTIIKAEISLYHRRRTFELTVGD